METIVNQAQELPYDHDLYLLAEDVYNAAIEAQNIIGAARGWHDIERAEQRRWILATLKYLGHPGDKSR